MILCISVFSVVISPFSFLILLIWFFSLCFLMSLANGLQFYLSFQRTSFWFCWFLLWSLLFLLHLFLRLRILLVLCLSGYMTGTPLSPWWPALLASLVSIGRWGHNSPALEPVSVLWLTHPNLTHFWLEASPEVFSIPHSAPWPDSMPSPLLQTQQIFCHHNTSDRASPTIHDMH